MSEEFKKPPSPLADKSGKPAGKKDNTGKIIGGIVIAVLLCLALIVLGVVALSGGFSPVDPSATMTPVANATKTPMPQGTPTSAFDNARPTNTAQPGSNPTAQPAGPTATPNAAEVSPQMNEMLQQMGYLSKFGVRTTTTPVPGAGPSLPTPPKMPKLVAKNDPFDFLRYFMEEYRQYAVAHGIEPSLYDVTDHIVVWIYATERGGAGKCQVPGDGTSKWFNANLESCGGLNLVLKDGGVAFVMAELGDSRVDNSACQKTPFYNGSTMGDWGLWLVKGTCNLTTGLVFIPDDTSYTVKDAVLK